MCVLYILSVVSHCGNLHVSDFPEDTGSSYIFLFEVTIKSLTTLKNLGCLFTAVVGAI